MIDSEIGESECLSEPICDFERLKISASPLFFFDRNEQRFEISFAEAFAAFALENFVENGRAVFDRFGEDLQQIAFVVAVNEDAEFLQAFDVFIDLADTFGNFVIIRIRHTQEFDAVCRKFV